MPSVQLGVARLRGDADYHTPCDKRKGAVDRGSVRSSQMQKTLNPIDVIIGEANDGHAELVEASLRETVVVNNLYRRRNCAAAYELVCDLCGDSTAGTDVSLLVLLDCGLPQDGGVGALTALKRDQRFSWIPIIMMTAECDPQHAEQCRGLGCEEYVTKWAVFLGLPAYVERTRFLADRATRIATRRLTARRRHDQPSMSNGPGPTAIARAVRYCQD